MPKAGGLGLFTCVSLICLNWITYLLSVKLNLLGFPKCLIKNFSRDPVPTLSTPRHYTDVFGILLFSQVEDAGVSPFHKRLVQSQTLQFQLFNTNFFKTQMLTPFLLLFVD